MCSGEMTAAGTQTKIHASWGTITCRKPTLACAAICRRPLHARLARYDHYDLAVAALLIGLVALAFATYKSYAISNDEEVQQRYGELIVAYYASEFTDQRYSTTSISICTAGCSTSWRWCSNGGCRLSTLIRSAIFYAP
jgi:hypothetical protein